MLWLLECPGILSKIILILESFIIQDLSSTHDILGHDVLNMAPTALSS